MKSSHSSFVLLKVLLFVVTNIWPIPVAVRSKAWVDGLSLTGIVGSNPAGGMDICVVFVV